MRCLIEGFIKNIAPNFIKPIIDKGLLEGQEICKQPGNARGLQLRPGYLSKIRDAETCCHLPTHPVKMEKTGHQILGSVIVCNQLV